MIFTRSKTKRPDLSSSTTNQVKDTTPKELGVSSSRVKDTTPQKRLAQSPALVEIPEDLHEAICGAAHYRSQSLGGNRNNSMLQRKLYEYERTVNILALYYKATHELPSSWEYDHKTPPSTYVIKPLKPLKKKKKKKTKRTIVRLPTINGTPLNQEEQKVWLEFETKNKRKAHQSIPILTKKIQVAMTNPVVNLIIGFAVEAFNDFYHKYVKEHGSNNITGAVPLECKYYKLTSEYYFYVTIDAIEQGKHGVYEAAVTCDRVTGARTLTKFVLTTTKSERSYHQVSTRNEEGERSFHQVSEYEKAWSSDSSGPEDFYNVSGMVPRTKTRGGGFNYHNPSSALHRYILYDGHKSNYCR